MNENQKNQDQATAQAVDLQTHVRRYVQGLGRRMNWENLPYDLLDPANLHSKPYSSETIEDLIEICKIHKKRIDQTKSPTYLGFRILEIETRSKVLYEIP